MVASVKFIDLLIQRSNRTPEERAATAKCVDSYLDGLCEADEALRTGRITLDLHDHYIDELHAACWSDGTLAAIEAVRAQIAAHS